jgi:Integrase core domain
VSRSFATSLASRRARPRRRQEAGPHRARCRPPSDRGAALHVKTGDPWHYAQNGRLGVLSCHHRCLQPLGLRRGDGGREVPTGDERATTAVASLCCALCFYADHGVVVERVLTDSGSAYVSMAHAIACRALSIKHVRTRPRCPRTNGKAERFIRTMLNGGAYGRIYVSSQDAAPHSQPGWTSTVAIDHTALSAAIRPSAVSAGTISSGLTPNRPPALRFSRSPTSTRLPTSRSMRPSRESPRCRRSARAGWVARRARRRWRKRFRLSAGLRSQSGARGVRAVVVAARGS